MYTQRFSIFCKYVIGYRYRSTQPVTLLMFTRDHLFINRDGGYLNEGVIELMGRFSLFLILIFFVSLTNVSAEFSQQIKTQDEISEYRLENGLRVILAPETSVNTVYLNLVYQVGALADPKGQSGMAHLLEHLMFKGTEHRSAAQLIDGLRQQAIRFNGTTSFHRTRYTATFDAEPAKLDYMLALEAERMASLRFDQAALQAELEVVLREIGTAQADSIGVLARDMLAHTTQNKGYGRHLLGTPAELADISSAALQKFHQDHYRPDNAVLILTGRFDAESALAAVKRHFAAVKSGPQVTREPAMAHATTYADKPAQLDITQGSINVVALSYPIPDADDPRHIPLSVLADIFAGEPHGRLYQALVVPGTVQGVFAIQEPLKDGGHYLFGALLGEEQSRDRALQGMIEQLEGIAQQPITAGELQRAQARALQIKDPLKNTVLSDPAVLADVLSEAVAQGDWQVQLARLGQLADLKSVRQQSQAFLNPQQRTIGHLYAKHSIDPAIDPETGPATDISAAPSISQHQLESRVTPLSPAWPATKEGSALAAVPLSDVAAFNTHAMDVEHSIMRSTLHNGMKIALRPLPGLSTPVQGRINLRFGDLQSLHGQRAVADLVGFMLVRGSKDLSYQQIVDSANRLGAGFYMEPNGGVLSVHFESPKQNLPELLQLIAEVLQEPAFLAPEFELVKRQRLQDLQRPIENAKQLAHLALHRYTDAYPVGDIRRRVEQDEMRDAMASLTREDARHFHQQFYGAQHGELSLSGDFDAQATQILLNDLFGGWLSKAPHHSVNTTHQAIAPVLHQVTASAPTNGHYLGRLYLPINSQTEDVAALYVLEHILGRHPVASRLGKRLREQEQLTYDIRSSIRVPIFGNAGWISIEGDHPPHQGRRVADIVKQEIANMAEFGLSQHELDLAKHTILSERHQALERPQSIANMLAGHLYDEVTLESWVERNHAYAGLTLEQVNAVARRYLKAADMVEISIGQNTLQQE